MWKCVETSAESPGSYNGGQEFYSAMHGMPARTSYEKALSIRPSGYLSNAWILTKRKKDLSRFLYYTKDHLA